ncbi:acid phosphatase [Trifolium repens]|nr:acid phosphatase [Trifolium repens]
MPAHLASSSLETGEGKEPTTNLNIHDPAFQYSFSDIYIANSLQKQWYNVLGNHDYRGDAEAQLNPFLHDIDHRWFSQRSFILHTEIAEFFFVDTTPFVDKDKYLSNLLKDLETALRDSTAKWKIVVGHHPVRSIGHHGDTKELLTHVLPILEVNNVDMYLNGHDHCLEHISSTSSQIQFLTSGGGSKAWKGDVDKNGKDGVKFYYMAKDLCLLSLSK